MAIPVSAAAGVRRPAAEPQGDWQTVLARAVRDPLELCRLLGLRAQLAHAGEGAAKAFPVLVPRPYLDRVRPGDPHDPLLAQVLPRQEEMAEVPRFAADPLGEAAATCSPGLLRKYKHRLLILASGGCGVHCRFCFRRHAHWTGFSRPAVCRSGFRRDSGDPEDRREPQRPADTALAGVASDPSIEEVILSGGDPLLLSDARLRTLVGQLADIPHLRRLRIHTRLPIVVPQRVTGEMLAWLRGTRLSAVVVVQANHAAEIDEAVAMALGRLVSAGVPVLSQSVLLRGVNDDADTLANLFTRLIDLRVMPYYLHQLDRVAGAAHFEVPVERGIELIRQLRARLPGYGVPRYVRDVPGEPNKRVLA